MAVSAIAPYLDLRAGFVGARVRIRILLARRFVVRVCRRQRARARRVDHLLVVCFFFLAPKRYGAFWAPTGGWTVGSLVAAIAKGQPGYGDHCFFEGMSIGRGGYCSVMYGS